jgi:DNA mismatch endonuclease (patch repair protein)
VAIFVHGCFWHSHDCARGRNQPKTRIGFWRPKLAENRLRDARTTAKLHALGWFVVVVWECEILQSQTGFWLRLTKALGKSQRRHSRS